MDNIEAEQLKDILKKAHQSGYLNGQNTSNTKMKQTETDDVSKSSSSESSEFADPSKRRPSTEIRIDPNYGWLLKDLNLNNDKRVIDVTEMIELNESKHQMSSTGPGI